MKELKKKLKWLFDEEQQLGINEQDRFHNSEEGKKQYEALFENHLAKKKNKKYVVTVKEVLVTDIIVSSSGKAEAAAIVQRMYDNEEIVLDYSNLIEQSVKAKLWK